MKLLRRVLIGIAALIVLVLAVTWQQQISRHAAAAPEAIAATVSDNDVGVEDGDDLEFRPLRSPKPLGVIVYPGAFTDVRGYAPVLTRLAAAGYRVVIVRMPFNLAILAPERAARIQAKHPDVKRWAIVGHSVGGTSASIFAHDHPDAVGGVIIWDSYPPAFASLADFPKPVWQIHRAKLDGLPPESFARQRGMFPAGSHWVAIPGGIHMYFGSFTGGGYQEDWAPEISQSRQHDLVVDATLRALADIEAQ